MTVCHKLRCECGGAVDKRADSPRLQCTKCHKLAAMKGPTVMLLSTVKSCKEAARLGLLQWIKLGKEQSGG